MSRVMQRNNHLKLPTVKTGEGVYLIDQNGKKYLDACGGAAVSCLGHSNKKVKEAVILQVEKIAYAHTSFFTNQAQEDLADNLLENSKGDFGRVYFVSGGSEAMEAALKIARQYFLEIGETDKKYFVAREQSYHGNTLGALAVGGNQWRRKPFDPLLIKSHLISACYAYRGKQIDESEFDYGQRVANELESKILELGSNNVAAFVAETVVGATSGAVAPVEGYFKRVREICDKYEVLLILDEIMCGMGRTGTLHACEQDGVQADLQTVAKGLAAGYQSLGALLIARKIVNAIDNGSGFFQHGHTYIGHPVACAAGLATQLEITERNLLENVRVQGENLQQQFKLKFKNHPHIGDIRGRGLFIGIELVANKTTKQAFASNLGLYKKIKAQAFENGLMIYPMGGTIDGVQGDHVLIAPPFIIDEDNVAQIVDKLSFAVDAALKLIPRHA